MMARSHVKPARKGSDEFVVAREPIGSSVPKGSRWKVTARYFVDLDGEQLVACVRVRCHFRHQALVLHFSAERFEQLFRAGARRANA